MRVIALHLNAGNDKNGNPRRVFVLVDPKNGDVVDAIDEGYQGSGAIPKEYDVIEGPSFNVSNADYRKFMLSDFRR